MMSLVRAQQGEPKEDLKTLRFQVFFFVFNPFFFPGRGIILPFTVSAHVHKIYLFYRKNCQFLAADLTARRAFISVIDEFLKIGAF